MEDDWLDQLMEDLKELPEPNLQDEKAKEQVMRAMSLLFLKIWMRFALDLGLKMRLSPADSDLGMYQGKNSWALNQSFNFSELSEVSITNPEPLKHALRAECYQWEGREHIRVIFQLSEWKDRGQDVMISYLIYKSLAKDFDIGKSVSSLKQGLGKWYMALAENEPSILWNFCRDKYEMAGV
jgi:hypothetical protein